MPVPQRRYTGVVRMSLPSITDRRIHVQPADVHNVLSRHMLADGYDIVMDLRKSRGSWVFDSRRGRNEIGRASCRERVQISAAAASAKKKIPTKRTKTKECNNALANNADLHDS